jgi:hypothetical protein
MLMFGYSIRRGSPDSSTECRSGVSHETLGTSRGDPQSAENSSINQWLSLFPGLSTGILSLGGVTSRRIAIRFTLGILTRRVLASPPDLLATAIWGETLDVVGKNFS